MSGRTPRILYVEDVEKLDAAIKETLKRQIQERGSRLQNLLQVTI